MTLKKSGIQDEDATKFKTLKMKTLGMIKSRYEMAKREQEQKKVTDAEQTNIIVNSNLL